MRQTKEAYWQQAIGENGKNPSKVLQNSLFESSVFLSHRTLDRNDPQYRRYPGERIGTSRSNNATATRTSKKQ